MDVLDNIAFELQCRLSVREIFLKKDDLRRVAAEGFRMYAPRSGQTRQLSRGMYLYW
jgi:hypothetical protein